jgi:hypothetical protein
MLWIGDRLSTLERLCIASFLAHGHDVHLYAYGPIGGVPAGTQLRDAREVMPESSVFTYASGLGKGSPSAFANEFRYKLLLERGGAWSDTDVVCLRPFTFLETMPHAVSSERLRPGYEEGGTRLANAGLLKAPPGSPFIARCHEVASAANRSALTWGQTGPRLVNRVIDELGFGEFVLPPEAICPVDWWDLTPILIGPVPDAPGTYGLHLWNEMWRRSGIDKDARYPPYGAYEVLKSRYLPPS